MSRRFDIAWPRKHLEWRRRPRGELWLIEAVLLERRIGANGKPSMQITCKLATIDEEHASPDGPVRGARQVSGTTPARG